jgi:RNA polymerase primary sigma factor
VDEPHTLSEIGARYSVASERIRQIEAKAIRKLKHYKKSKILKEVR